MAGLTTLAQAYLQLGQYEKARPTFEAVIRADPDNKKAFYGLGMTCARSGNREEARKYMDQFAKLDAKEFDQRAEGLRTFSDQPSSRNIVLRTSIDAARCYRKHRQPEKAEPLLRNAAALAPDDVECRVDLVTLCDQTGRDRAALEVCEELRRIDPDNADHWMNFGLFSARLGDFEGGLAALRHALELDPGNRRYREVYQAIQEGK